MKGKQWTTQKIANLFIREKSLSIPSQNQIHQSINFIRIVFVFGMRGGWGRRW
jgi:hypothetical protein